MTKPWTNKRWAPVIAGTLLMFSAASANATIQFFTGPGAVQPDENVLLDQGSTGLTVFGETNQTQTSVSFRGLEDLTIPRSEEHTSELQSLMRISYAVFCLKKKNKNKTNYYNSKHQI